MAFRFHSISPTTRILQRSLNWCHGDLTPTPQTIEIVTAAGKFESFLKEMLEYVNTDEQHNKIGRLRIEYLLSQVTQEQMEKLVLPKFIYILDKKHADFVDDLYNALPVIFNKISDDCLKNLLPKLLKFLQQQRIPNDLCEKCFLICIEKLDADTLEKVLMPKLLILLKSYENHFIEKVILKCMEKMDTAALRRSLQPELESRFSKFEEYIENKDGDYLLLRGNRDVAFAPYLALISRFSQEENNMLSKKLLTHLSLHLQVNRADEILTFIKQLRGNNIYVNNDFFQAVQKIVFEENEKNLKAKRYFQLYIANFTADQAKRFVEACLAQQSLNTFHCEKLAALPIEIYPMQLRMKVLKFLQAYLNDEHVIKLLPGCLKINDSSPEFRKVLITIAQHAFNKIETSKSNKYHYCKLLESCASIMTDDEINCHILEHMRMILPTIKDAYSDGADFIKSMNECLAQIFLQINNNDIHREFFNFYVMIYFRYNIGHEVLPALCEKVDKDVLLQGYRKILHCSTDYLNADRKAYLLALFSKRIPGARPEVEEKAEFKHAVKTQRRTCAVM